MNEYFVNLNIKEMPETMRPREKLIAQGEDKLDEAELLAIVLGSGTREMNALELARQLLTRHGGSLRYLMAASLEELTTERGIGMAKAVSIKAAIEMGRRVVGNIQLRKVIKSPEDVQEAVRELAMEEMRHYDREHFRVMYLDRKGGLITMQDISIGGLHSSIVHPREVFKIAVKKSAASMILVHNHPSGDPTPSQEDIEITRRLIEAGRIMGIEILDHVIIGEVNYCSLKARGLI
ncbi:MAG: DNA repair protein RadC [Syntrophomonas sp.]|uniref:RadC family protein n=1 Tax=Syntrophomonas sp. TaxID=2053627 RepID=UPI002624ED42|nr:DNA repair protein RadC [Syntrophomonas sp.]MDD2510172.1 DNA repair protein RadC [Syntrophomonas sp.]MDD3879488.1 DNA repair protein RadC [Syntrophomonas sp.]MDD4625779.1 DNA repair protein RadC [Syntrophomonas sp.]